MCKNDKKNTYETIKGEFYKTCRDMGSISWSWPSHGMNVSRHVNTDINIGR